MMPCVSLLIMGRGTQGGKLMKQQLGIGFEMYTIKVQKVNHKVLLGLVLLLSLLAQLGN